MLPHQVTMNELDADTAKAIVTKYFASLSLLQRSGRLAASDGDLPERPANIKAAIKFVYIFGAADEVASLEDLLRSAWLALARFLPPPEYARAHTIQEELASQTARIEAGDPNLAKDGEALRDLLASTNELNALIANRADALRLEFGHLQAERSRFRELQRDAEGDTGERGNKSAMSGDPTQGADPTEKLLPFARRIQNFVREPPLAGAQVAVPEECADAARVIMFHWGRTFRTFQSIAILVQSGLCEDAIVLLRTLMEIFIEVVFLAKRPEDARAYLEHGIRTEVEWWDRVARTASADIRVRAGLDTALARLDLSEPTIQPARPKAGLKSAWHPKFASVKSRAREAGVAPWLYEQFYSMASRYTHGSGDWLLELSRMKPGAANRVSYDGLSKEGGLALLLGCWLVLEQLRLMNGVLNLSLDPPLLQLEEAYRELAATQWGRVMHRYSGRGTGAEAES